MDSMKKIIKIIYEKMQMHRNENASPKIFYPLWSYSQQTYIFFSFVLLLVGQQILPYGGMVVCVLC